MQNTEFCPVLQSKGGSRANLQVDLELGLWRHAVQPVQVLAKEVGACVPGALCKQRSVRRARSVGLEGERGECSLQLCLVLPCPGRQVLARVGYGLQHPLLPHQLHKLLRIIAR